MNGRAIAIIPARGGSKRIPGKNLRAFCGKPLIQYAIQVALVSGAFDTVAVSTDDQEIAATAKRCGAEVPFLRPVSLADDYTGTDEVVIHALTELMGLGDAYEYVCCVYATAPLVTSRDLQQGLEILKSRKAKAAFSVASFPSPIFRAFRRTEQGLLGMIWPEHYFTRSQDLEEAYFDAGQFYWARVPDYLENPRLFKDQAAPVFIERCRAQDIDTEEDFRNAQLLYSAMIRHEAD
jgi:pseudaminic acid cytidylyltransferase